MEVLVFHVLYIISSLWTMYSLSEQNAKMADTHTNFIVEAKYFKANKLVGQKYQNWTIKALQRRLKHQQEFYLPYIIHMHNL